MDINSLLQPISEDAPTGIDPRSDSSPKSTYNTLKDARNSARAAERNRLFDSGDNTADIHWQSILKLAPTTLETQAKDIEICCWLIEALTRKRGFVGLLNGLQLLNGLIKNFWDGVYPLPDEDGIENTVFGIKGLNGESSEGVLIPPIRNIHITAGQGEQDFSLWQYKQALDTRKIADGQARQKRTESAGFSFEDIEKSVQDTSDDECLAIRTNVRACKREAKEISNLLDSLCGDASPPMGNIVNTLDDCESAVNHLFKERFLMMDTTNDEGGANETTGDSTKAPSAYQGAIKSREQAFQQLVQISEFFRATEPHSPISYVLKKAVKWGKMPLGDLIEELIPDQSAQEQFRTLTGVKSRG